MQFETRYRAGIADGSITLTFRRWRRPQAVPGNIYRTAAGRIVVDAVDIVASHSITDAEAKMSGYEDAVSLREDLRGDQMLPVYRVRFHAAPDGDPRDALAAAGDLSEAERDQLQTRLERLDRASTSGPWTARTLELVRDNPTVRAGDLAPQMGQELLAFKLNVRKLKNLGLTLSLGTGYRLSPRGEAFMAGHGRS
jgi:hypothetical protein